MSATASLSDSLRLPAKSLSISNETVGRTCFGLELQPKFVDVIVTRWQNLTGKQATLEGSGLTFEKIKETRPLEAVNA